LRLSDREIMSTRAVSVPVSAIRVRVYRASLWAVAVWAAAALYATLLSIESVRAHDEFVAAGAFDTAIYDQLLWLLAHGHEPFSTILSRPLLADHFQPALVLLTPLYWLDLGVPGLLTAQSIGLALTAPALYALARVFGATPALASMPALLWLVCPYVASVNLFSFRPSTFVAPLLVLSVLAAMQARHALLVITTVLALGLREDIALTYLMLGTLLVFLGKRRVGGMLTLGSAIWFVVAWRTIQSLSGSLDAFGERFAGDRGDSVGDVVVWVLTHPLEALGDFASESLSGLVRLLVSTGGLAILSPSWMLLAVPNALHNALSAYEPQHALIRHYHLLTVAGLFIGAAIGAGRLASVGPSMRRTVAGFTSFAVFLAVFGGVWVRDGVGLDPVLDRTAMERVLDRIPPGAVVASAPRLLPHLSRRSEVYVLPQPFVPLDWGSPLTPEAVADRAEHVRFVVYVEGNQLITFYKGDIADLRTRLLRDGFVVVVRSGPVELLERG